MSETSPSPIRRPAVAGLFYPEDRARLADMVDALVPTAEPARRDQPPRALIVPHAGYEYSGPVAGTAYARLRPFSGSVRRVVLLGPAHFVALQGLAVSGAAGFATPLGTVEVDDEWRKAVLAFPQVHVDDAPHRREHSLEVQLPFLQRVLGDFRILPLLAGRATAADVATVLLAVGQGPETLVVVSTDLSHYLARSEAVDNDRATASAIEALDVEAIRPPDACGAVALRGLLEAVRRLGATVRLLDLRNSGDTAGSPDRVVGYGSFAVA